MIRVPIGTDPLLGRPFALYDTVLDERGQPVAIDVVYLVVGKMTNLLAHVQPGELIDAWGPLGNGFPEPAGSEAPHVGLVAGGIGQTPFLAHIRELLGRRGYGGQTPRRRVRRVPVYYGVRPPAPPAGGPPPRRRPAPLASAASSRICWNTTSRRSTCSAAGPSPC